VILQKAMVAICTRNPNRDKLSLVLNAIYNNSGNYRVVLIDNASDVAIASYVDAKQYHLLSIIREENIGNSFARLRALRELKDSELLIFVDDDNILDSSFIETALQKSAEYPHWGVYGGKQLLHPAVDCKSKFVFALPYLAVRDLGSLEMEAKIEAEWHPIEPVGAGMCVRPEVSKIMLSKLKDESVLKSYLCLGRKGRSLTSGEDSFIARIGYESNFWWGYTPQLSLDHYLNQSRFSFFYLTKLFIGYGRTEVLLGKALNHPYSHTYPISFLETLVRFFGSTIVGRSTMLESARLVGQYLQLRRMVSN